MITEQRCLSLLTKCKTLDVVKHIHALLLKTALDADPLLAGKLILHCAITISDVLDYACRFFLHFPNPDVFMYNTLIRGHAESDSPQNSLVTYIEMRRTLALPPDSFSLAFAFKAAANIRCLPTGVQLHCQAVIHGLDGHLFVGTTMISVYAECGCLRFARKVFEEMFEPNVIAWNAVLTACFRCGDVKAAEIMFGRMTERNSTSWNVMVAGYMKAGEMEFAKKVFMEMPLKDGVSWSTLIVGCGHHGCFDQAFGFFREMHRVGLRPNEVSLTGVLSACAHAGAFEFGRILHAYVEKAGLAWMITVNNALLDMYSKCGNIHMACFVFERMAGRKNIVTWTSMIAGLAMQGCGEKAICFFHQMEESGITPDGIAFISILYACSHAGLVDEGQRLFSRMKSVYGIEPAIEHYGCMVDLYGRAGRLHKAYEFINQMQMPPTAIIWRTLLGACSIHKNVELAEQVNKKLSEIDPNNCSDHILLSNVYAVVGKWKDVAAVRRTMKTQRIQKTPGWSIIEINKVLYSFTAGKVEGNTVWEEAYEKLKEIMLKLRLEEGYAPEVGSVLHDIGEEEKEDALSRHSEKLAVAFGMSRLFKGKVIRIVKNLRICRDCHLVMKLISKVYGLEIVVRDRSRFHSIGNGMCSCRDYW